MVSSLRKARLSAGLSVIELADRAQVTRQLIYLLEEGSRKGSLDTWLKLSRVLDVPVDQLVGEKVDTSLTLEWVRTETSEEKFEELIKDAELEELVDLEREVIDRFRELREQGTYPSGSRAPMYPNEFYILWHRANTIQREIVERRKSPEEAQITPELKRKIKDLEKALKI